MHGHACIYLGNPGCVKFLLFWKIVLFPQNGDSGFPRAFLSILMFLALSRSFQAVWWIIQSTGSHTTCEDFSDINHQPLYPPDLNCSAFFSTCRSGVIDHHQSDLGRDKYHRCLQHVLCMGAGGLRSLLGEFLEV